MPRPKMFTVRLSDVDRVRLLRLVSTGTHSARMIRRARVLLELDEDAGPVADQVVVAERVGVGVKMVRAVASGSWRPAAMSRPRSAASRGWSRQCRRS